MGEHPFDADTRVEPVGGGVFKAAISDRWTALGGGANGGYTLAVCLQALRQAMPSPDPLVVSAFFLRRAALGPAEVHAHIARSGGRSATGDATLVQEGRETVRVTATFADLAQASGRTFVNNVKPDLPPPEETVDLLGGRRLPGITVADRIEYRGPQVLGWASGRPSGAPRVEFWMRFAEGRDADTLSLPMLVDAAAPAVLELGETGSATLQLTVHVRGRPAPGWLACRVETRHVIGGFHEEDFEIWDAKGNLVAQSRQLGLLPDVTRSRPAGPASAGRR